MNHDQADSDAAQAAAWHHEQMKRQQDEEIDRAWKAYNRALVDYRLGEIYDALSLTR